MRVSTWERPEDTIGHNPLSETAFCGSLFFYKNSDLLKKNRSAGDEHCAQKKYGRFSGCAPEPGRTMGEAEP